MALARQKPIKMMFLLFQANEGWYDDCVEVTPFAVSKDDWKIQDYLLKLLEKSIAYDQELEKHKAECKGIIRTYLIDNYDAITGWRDVRAQVKTSYLITDGERDQVINFLCANCSYSYGENIVEAPYDCSFISKYCNINKLKKPYPKLPQPPDKIFPYYKKENFYIKEVKYLD